MSFEYNFKPYPHHLNMLFFFGYRKHVLQWRSHFMAQSTRQQRVSNPAHAAHRGPPNAPCTNPLWTGQLPSSKSQENIYTFLIYCSYILVVYYVLRTIIQFLSRCTKMLGLHTILVHCNTTLIYQNMRIKQNKLNLLICYQLLSLLCEFFTVSLAMVILRLVSFSVIWFLLIV